MKRNNYDIVKEVFYNHQIEVFFRKSFYGFILSVPYGIGGYAIFEKDFTDREKE